VTLWQRTHQDTAQDESLRPINAGSGRFGLATGLADTWEIARAAGRCRDEPQQFGASTPTHGSFRHTDRRESQRCLVHSRSSTTHDSPRSRSYGRTASSPFGDAVRTSTSSCRTCSRSAECRPSLPDFAPKHVAPRIPASRQHRRDKANSVSYSRGPLLTGPAEHIKRMARTGQPDRQFHAPPTHRGIRE
jgi:hypothetical protein